MAKLYARAGSAGDRVLLDPTIAADFSGDGLIGATNAPGAELAADEYAFLLWNLAWRGSNPTV